MAKSKKPAPNPTDAFLAAQGAGGDDLLTVAPPKSIDLKNLERHPLSEKYGPPLAAEEMLGLATDIEKHGQHETIKLYEGKVLAGWNRYRACLSKNITPRVENYEGTEPEAVAFGTNVIRRRMSSVLKAYMGAIFYQSSKEAGKPLKQVEVAKLCNVSLNRLNECAQLLALETDDAKQAREVLATNPEITGSQFNEMLLECGIVRSTPRPAGPRTELEPDDDLNDLDDDLTGGAIDGLGDIDEEEEEGTTPKKRAPIGEGAADIPAVGSKGPSMTKPNETMVSRIAKHFKQLSPAEQTEFVSFAWGKLQPALNTAIATGKVTYTPPAAPGKPGKAKGAAYVAERKAKAPPATAKAAPAKGKATPAAKKAPTAPAKAPAKPAAKASKAK